MNPPRIARGSAFDRLARWLSDGSEEVGLLVADRYEVLRRIGRGGMGEVFLAQDRRLDRPVALKVIAAADEESRALLDAEARTMSRIDHPGIVPVHDSGLFPDGRLFCTMKFVEGRTLEEILRARPGPEVTIPILAEAARIVHVAHEQGVVHRDLKPSNLMIDAKGRVYVLDWGIAAALGTTRALEIVGTVAYMAPEQARGEYEVRSDVYALGMILHEFLAGRPAVTGNGRTALLERARPPLDKAFASLYRADVGIEDVLRDAEAARDLLRRAIP